MINYEQSGYSVSGQQVTLDISNNGLASVGPLASGLSYRIKPTSVGATLYMGGPNTTNGSGHVMTLNEVVVVDARGPIYFASDASTTSQISVLVVKS